MPGRKSRAKPAQARHRDEPPRSSPEAEQASVTNREVASLREQITEQRREIERLGHALAAREAELGQYIQARQALRDSEERLELALSAGRSGAWDWDMVRDVAIVSPSYLELYGFPPDQQVTYDVWLASVHPEDRERARRYGEEFFRSGTNWNLEYRIEHPEHGERWMEAVGRLQRDETGRPVRFIGVQFDVTERKRAEELLLAQNRALEVIAGPVPLVGALSALIRIVEEQSGHTAVASVMLVDPVRRCLRSCAGPGLPQWYHDALDGIEAAAGVGTCAAAAARGEVVVTPDIAAAKSWEGISHLPLSLGLRAAWSMPIIGSDGHVLGTFGTYFRECREPTERERQIVEGLCRSAALAIERRQAEDQVREAARRKDEFLAVLGHELRNPLAALSTALELLRYEVGEGESIRELRLMMERQLAHLLRLVDDLLDVARIDRGKIELQRAALDVGDIIDAALEQMQPLIEERGHELIAKRTESPLPIQGDHQRLTQVVGNLLSNAARYTPRGGTIVLTTELDGDEAVIRITDNGLGIPPERLGGLFEMFSQVPEHRVHTGGGGLGIGLALSRGLLALHGGTVEARSAGLNQGAEFIVRLPLSRNAARGDDDSVNSDAPRRLDRRRVLIVDDNVDVAKSLKRLLDLDGHLTEVVTDGPAALEAIETFRPDVVLLDIGLPGTDGYEVAQRIREMPYGRETRIFALTGWGQKDDARRAREAGMDAHLTKPVDLSLLRSLLAAAGPRE